MGGHSPDSGWCRIQCEAESGLLCDLAGVQCFMDHRPSAGGNLGNGVVPGRVLLHVCLGMAGVAAIEMIYISRAGGVGNYTQPVIYISGRRVT